MKSLTHLRWVPHWVSHLGCIKGCLDYLGFSIDGVTGMKEKGTAGRFGVGYNAAVWAKCRRMAPEFLREAAQRLSGDGTQLFDEAAEHYGEVSRALDRVAEAFPFSVEHSMDPIRVDAASAKAAEDLRQARASEEAGLGVLRKVVDSIA